MNKNRALILTLAISIILACSVTAGTSPTSVPTSVPSTLVPNTVSATPQVQDQLGTFVAQTMTAQQPTSTEASAPTAVPPTTQVPAVPLTLSQWNGKFRWFGSLNPVTFVIQQVNGSSFTGAMYWTFSTCRVTERVEGESYQDITTAPEQNRWALHPDFQNGDKGGTWLRWTQNESIGATRCYLTISGDWWYAHIGSNGHMTGIHFTNSTNTVPDTGATFDFTQTQ